jgi:hypothetical protein
MGIWEGESCLMMDSMVLRSSEVRGMREGRKREEEEEKEEEEEEEEEKEEALLKDTNALMTASNDGRMNFWQNINSSLGSSLSPLLLVDNEEEEEEGEEKEKEEEEEKEGGIYSLKYNLTQ